MTRAAFNTTCDIFAGPGSATPGVLVGTFTCRLVLQHAITVEGVDSPVRPAYLTLETYEPVGMWTTPFIAVDGSLADRVAVPSGSSPAWWVWFTESIVWQGQPLYYRANLIELPAPHADAIAMEDSGLVMQEDTSYVLAE